MSLHERGLTAEALLLLLCFFYIVRQVSRLELKYIYAIVAYGSVGFYI